MPSCVDERLSMAQCSLGGYPLMAGPTPHSCPEPSWALSGEESIVQVLVVQLRNARR